MSHLNTLPATPSSGTVMSHSVDTSSHPKPCVQGGALPWLQSMANSRLRRHVDYQRAYAVSRKRQSASMSWFLSSQTAAGFAVETLAGPRVGLTAGKVLGKAHERNRIKRRMREVVRRHIDLLPAGCDLILHPRRSVLTIDFLKLEAEVVRILQQATQEAARLNSVSPLQQAI